MNLLDRISTTVGKAAAWLTLVMVLVSGEMGGGAQRWLDIGIRFQPSELMKLAVPAMLAWNCGKAPQVSGLFYCSEFTSAAAAADCCCACAARDCRRPRAAGRATCSW